MLLLKDIVTTPQGIVANHARVWNAGKDCPLYGLHVPRRYLRPVCALYPVSFFTAVSLDTPRPAVLFCTLLIPLIHGLCAFVIPVDK
jgi:hypothetical protein